MYTVPSLKLSDVDTTKDPERRGSTLRHDLATPSSTTNVPRPSEALDSDTTVLRFLHDLHCCFGRRSWENGDATWISQRRQRRNPREAADHLSILRRRPKWPPRLASPCPAGQSKTLTARRLDGTTGRGQPQKTPKPNPPVAQLPPPQNVSGLLCKSSQGRSPTFSPPHRANPNLILF
ncbi:hypothetical protein BU24DRAFT_467094 [Aaosphaeria arxii CBS 175.79]|uniref:Uncharacterized protein n=1 Tax=Aaosphaeria arxii CBS 175.79 TaxID=1450172 RepID=A0A6A5XBX5_9PLEO|nr:uncharacterized protein BU24DRAFT_467094 [Aaosphaeria arxii CBS 175.79]KAF2010458.1 hypothetical protein BU24DRAFT_467094 [Aaosphaeria arxii CBS 175.79]